MPQDSHIAPTDHESMTLTVEFLEPRTYDDEGLRKMLQAIVNHLGRMDFKHVTAFVGYRAQAQWPKCSS